MDYFIKTEIVEKIQSDVVFRTRLAAAMGLGERAIWNFALKYLKKPSANTYLTKKSVLDFFETEGYDIDEDILTTEPPE